MIILGLDFETTGTNPQAEDFEVIEVGAALFNGLTGQLIETRSWLIYTNAAISAEVVKLTGITSQVLTTEGTHLKEVDEELSHLIRRADYLCAHNHTYEKQVLELFFGLSEGEAQFKNWIDTMTDLPNGAGNGNLTTVAANHRLINPFPHRALPDVLIMLAVLAEYSFSEIQKIIEAPIYRAVIQFSYDSTNQKQNDAKSLGFRWHPDSKTWRKDIRNFQWEALKEEAEAKDFRPFLLDFNKQPQPIPF